MPLLLSYVPYVVHMCFRSLVVLSRYGFVIAVTTIDNIGLGALQQGRGFALYPVKYKVRNTWPAGILLVVLCCVFPGHCVSPV